MKRFLCWFAVLGVIAVPAVAAACWPMWGRPAYAPVYSAPMYAQPVYVAPPVWQPAPGYVLPPPRIEPIPRMATPAPAPAPGMGTAIPAKMPPRVPTIEPIRTVGGTDAPVQPAATPKKAEPPAVVPEPGTLPIDPPKGTDLKFPTVEIPKSLQLDKKLPPLELPKEPDMRSIPKVPAVGAARDPVLPAIPSPAPAPESLIPPPSVPLVPDPKKRDPLPSLTLPPDTPVAPPTKTDSTSRSSPLSESSKREMSVNIFPATGGEKLTTGYRIVGFYNHTTSDLTLTIEDRVVKLPAKTYLHAQLAPTFTWGHSDRASTRETVPEGAGGVDVVFRE